MKPERTIRDAFNLPHEKVVANLYIRLLGLELSPYQRHQMETHGNVLKEHKPVEEEHNYFNERASPEQRINEQFERQLNDYWNY